MPLDFPLLVTLPREGVDVRCSSVLTQVTNKYQISIINIIIIIIIIIIIVVAPAFTTMGDFRDFTLSNASDFTLSNARRFYSSKGANLAAKGLELRFVECNERKNSKLASLCYSPVFKSPCFACYWFKTIFVLSPF